MTTLERFWAKVDVQGPDDCWEWTGARHAQGYGHLRAAGRTMKAHRVSALIHFGPFDRRMDVRHTCDNPPCVNPNHLRVGTTLQNVRDCIDKGRFRNHNQAKTHCLRGHAFTDENTYITKLGRRNCRTCNYEKAAALRKGLYQEWKDSYA